MLISVLNIKLTCEWHKAIKLNYKNTRTNVIVVLKGSKHYTWYLTVQHWRNTADYVITLMEVHMRFMANMSWIPVIWYHTQRHNIDKAVSWQVPCVDPPEDHTFLCFGLYRYSLTSGIPSRSLATDVHKCIEISLCTRWTTTCFGQPYGHLRGLSDSSILHS